ncbi:calcium-binding protein [Arenibaculum sp.]|jgi:hypothetical protein|uniref:calcium-binding protein n=1 Tax=Arenibaculum sp. TaxID=2865862 RepID=UPI002E1318AB|nr:calcium-binding protein [Arenibaculum sp.]
MATIYGTGNADTLNGTNGQDYMFGYDGDDRMVGFGGDDYLFGNAGHDVLFGYYGSDSLFGGIGDDILSGDDGDDFLDGEEGHDVVLGGDGNDLLFGRAGDDLLDGGSGDDELYGHDGTDMLFGGDGADHLSGGNDDDELYGGEGDDELFAGSGNDILDAGRGDNLLNAGSGDDLILFDVIGNIDGWERDLSQLDGGDGYDTLRINNQGFADNVRYPYDSDEPFVPTYTIFWGEDHPEREYDGFLIQVGTTADVWADTGGPSVLYHGIERIEVNGDEDHIFYYNGSRQNLTVVGGDGDDDFNSGSGDEILVGGNGDDYYGLTANPSYSGDSDTIQIANGTTGNDRVSNFSERDLLEFVGMGPGEVAMSIVDADTVFDWGEGTITLLGYHAGADDWLIA